MPKAKKKDDSRWVVAEVRASIALAMARAKMTRKDIAKKTGKPLAYLNRILDRSDDMDMRDVTDIMRAMGLQCHVYFVPQAATELKGEQP